MRTRKVNYHWVNEVSLPSSQKLHQKSHISLSRCLNLKSSLLNFPCEKWPLGITTETNHFSVCTCLWTSFAEFLLFWSAVLELKLRLSYFSLGGRPFFRGGELSGSSGNRGSSPCKSSDVSKSQECKNGSDSDRFLSFGALENCQWKERGQSHYTRSLVCIIRSHPMWESPKYILLTYFVKVKIV